MLDDTAAHDEKQDAHELELLEEVVRQAEARLAALAQTKQAIAAQATTIMTWMLTLLLALIAALASIGSGSAFAPVKPLLLLFLLIGVGPATVGSLFAVLTSLWPAGPKEVPWHHAGANPRLFIPSIPEETKLSPIQRWAGRLRKRLAAGRAPLLQTAAPPRTKKDALHNTAARYARAIDENERGLAAMNKGVGTSLALVVLVGISALLAPIVVEWIPHSWRSAAQAPGVTALAASGMAVPDATTPSTPGTKPP